MLIIGKSKVGSVDGKLVVALNEKVAKKLGIEFGNEVTFSIDKDENLAVERTVYKGTGRRAGGNTAGRGRRGGQFGGEVEKVGLKKAAPKGTGRRGRTGGGNVRCGHVETPF